LAGNGGSSADYIQLSYAGFLTPHTLPYVAGVSPTAADVQSELTSITALKDNVVVEGNAGGPFAITFTGALQSVPVAPIGVQFFGGVTGIASSSPSSRLPTSEVQRLTFSPALTNGTFTLSYVPPGATASQALTTAPIIWGTNTVNLAKNIENALNAPTFFGPGSVVVTPPNPPPAGQNVY